MKKFLVKTQVFTPLKLKKLMRFVRKGPNLSPLVYWERISYQYLLQTFHKGSYYLYSNLKWFDYLCSNPQANPEPRPQISRCNFPCTKCLIMKLMRRSRTLHGKQFYCCKPFLILSGFRDSICHFNNLTCIHWLNWWSHAKEFMQT